MAGRRQPDVDVAETVATAGDLVVDLERPLPHSLPVGTGTAVFVVGTCFHPREQVERLEIVIDGVRSRLAAFGMPRPDLAGPHVTSRLSGFWGTIRVGPRHRPGVIELQMAARLGGGAELIAPLGRIEVARREAAPGLPAEPQRSAPGLIAVCMATFEPDLRLFRAQIESLRRQSDDRWICLISDDCSNPDHFERVREIVGPDRRFALSRSDARLGFYRNFERALGLVPDEADLIALCDQDDRWHPDKLRMLREAIGSAQLVYSDQRLVDSDGRVLRDTLWKGRRNNHTNLASMLIANTITGAATLFRRELTDVLLPFPDTPGYQFHDHWLGAVALAAGEVAYVDHPLYDYVQHAGAVFGDVTQGPKVSVVERMTRWRGLWNPGELLTRWRAAYFYGYLAREVQAQTLLVRCERRLTAAKRRALERFIASAHSPTALAWLALRSVRSLVGRTETLGSETQLACGVLWKWVIDVRRRRSRRLGGTTFDASLPPLEAFNQRRLRRWRAKL